MIINNWDAIQRFWFVGAESAAAADDGGAGDTAGGAAAAVGADAIPCDGDGNAASSSPHVATTALRGGATVYAISVSSITARVVSSSTESSQSE